MAKEPKQGVPPPTPAVDSCHALLLWMIPHLDRMPRQRRFTLGERLESELLAVLHLLVVAAYQRDRAHELTEANARLAVCRHLWRLCMELQVTSLKSYEHGTRLLLDLGRQVGGWLKHAKVPA